MQIICQTDFLPAVQVTQLAPRQYALTVIVKATFDMAPGTTASVAKKQEFATGDTPYPDDPDGMGPPRYPSDFVPWKPRADLLLVGSCHSAGGRPVSRCPVAFAVGDVRRELEVTGDRAWGGLLGAKVSEPAPFQQLEIRYENSFGGPEYPRNPVGKGSQKQVTDQDRTWPMPNILDTTDPTPRPESGLEPAGFGPLPLTWPQRSSKTGTYDSAWQIARFPGYPVDFDWAFHNAAPEPQQLAGYLKGDETLLFENLHAEHSSYRSLLPGLRTRCFVRSARDPREVGFSPVGKHSPTDDIISQERLKREEDKYFFEVVLNIDTLWVDMQAEQLVLLWRGMTPIVADDYAEVEQLFVLTEERTEAKSLEEYARLCERLLEESETIEGSISQLPGGIATQMPDVATEIAKAEQQMAEVLSEVVDVDATNQQLTAALGDECPQIPQLAGAGLAAQIAGLEQFTSELSTTVDQLVEQKKAFVYGHLDDAGIDPPPASEAEKQQRAAILQGALEESGIVQQLQEADEMVKNMAKDAFQMGVNLSALGVVGLGDMLMGLRGVGVDTARLESDLGITIGKDPLTREDVERRAKAGESFQGETLLDLDLSGLELRGLDFSEAVLVKVNLSSADLSQTNFRRAVLSEVDFAKAKLVKAQFTESNLGGSTLTEADLSHAVLDGAICGSTVMDSAVLKQVSARGTDFSDSDLSRSCLDAGIFTEADFSKCKLDQTSFRQAGLQKTAFDQASGTGTDFTAADLTNVRASRSCSLPGAVFHQARMAGANWSNSDLSNADLSWANADGAFFISANMAATNLTAASLKLARLSKATLQQCQFIDANLMQTSLDKTDLTEANLTRANAYNADFFEAEMKNAILDDANLMLTVLSWT